jgi:hypothetical protein
MGLLSPDYYKDALQNVPQKTAPAAAAPATTATAEPVKQGIFDNTKANPVVDYVFGFANKAVGPLQVPGTTPVKKTVAQPLTEQQQVERFGTPVGSAEYYRQKAESPLLSFLPQQLGSAVGMKFPDMETWDKMSRADQVGHTAAQALGATVGLVLSLPKVAAETVVRYGSSVVRPWVDLAAGKNPTWDSVSKQEVTVPWLGTVPSYWKSFDEAKKSGLGNAGAALSTGSQMLGDVTLIPSLAEAAVKAFQPRTALKEGETIKASQPIQTAIIKENETLAAKRGNPNYPGEYYDLPKTIAKKYGGDTNNIKLKVMPASEGTAELSVVKLQSGVLPKAIEYVKNKLGGVDKAIEGKFGKEIKLEGQIIKFDKDKMAQEGASLIRRAEEQPLPSRKTSTGLVEIKRKIKLSEDPVLAEEEARVIQEMQLAAPGKRVLIRDDSGHVVGVMAEGSTVPSWIPEELRDTRAIKSVADHILSGTMPTTVKEMRLYNLVDEMIGEKPAKIAPMEGEDVFIARYKKAGMKNDKIAETMNIPVERVNDVLSGKKKPSAIPAEPFKEPFPSGTITEQPKQIASIPPKALKGFEKKPITSEQLGTLDMVAEVNKLNPELKDAIVRTLTGKQVVGELTQAEYIDVVQTLARLNNAEQFSMAASMPFISRYASPTRHWTRTVEERTGLPIYSNGYMPMETAQRLAKVSEQTQLGQLWSDPIIQKYAKAGYAEERRLVRAYREGNTAAIVENEALSPATKTELISAAKIFDDYYAKVGPDVNVPIDIFLDQYSPHISDIGGKFQLYKATTDMPKQAGFFAKEKRVGSISTLVDDEWALAEIYTRAGYKAKYLDPVLKNINEFYDKMPPEIQGSFKSYVQEKLGYAGEFERALDGVAIKLNNKLGLNLPPDVGRRFTNQAMNTMYSAAMSQPATWLRNSFQYPMMGYAYLGPKFAGQAIAKALSKEGMEEFLKSGFHVDLGVPFGEELAQEITAAGRISNTYKNVTQGILKPNSIVEAQNRAIVYHQSKMIFEDAIAKYNAGKIRWEQVEKELDFNGLSAADRNLVRQDLVSGNIRGAFEKYVQNVIDDTQFPYRRGAEMRLSYGSAGHIGTSFMQWPNEYFHTLSGWVKTGQYDKLIRWYGVTSLIINTFKEQTGWDFSKSFLLGPLASVSPAPVIKLLTESVTALSNWMNDNEEALEKNKDNIANQLKLTYPAGVEIANVKNFFKSYDAGPVGPNGTYPVFDAGGRLKYYANFKDIFWQAMGMPTAEKTQVNQLQKEMINAKFNYTQAKAKALEYYQQEKYDQANDLIQQYGVKLSPADFDKYYIPLTQRTYDSLPPVLKAQFAPRVFPATTNK